MKFLCSLGLALLLQATLDAQFSGSRGGESIPAFQQRGSKGFDPTVQQYIEVEGKIELRVKPDQIRIVIAVIESAKTSAECEKKLFAKLASLKNAFRQNGIRDENVVDDFIAVLPQYEFAFEKRDEQEVAVERLTGYEMQSNLHIQVANNTQAMQVIRSAFAMNVSDVIGFDYGSTQLDAMKKQATEQATAAAKEKADTLLTAMFDEKPRVINIRSETQVVLPDQLYRSFENSSSESYSQSKIRTNMPVIRVSRPQNTYYKGFFELTLDRQPNMLPMQNEISIIANVSIFYESPVASEYRQLENPPSPAN